MRCECGKEMAVSFQEAELRRYGCDCGASRTTIEVDPALIYGLQARLFWSERLSAERQLQAGGLSA